MILDLRSLSAKQKLNIDEEVIIPEEYYQNTEQKSTVIPDSWRRNCKRNADAKGLYYGRE